MPRVIISNVGRMGIITDIPPHELPPEAWTTGQNIRFLEGAVAKAAGYAEVYDTPGPGTPPLYGFSFRKATVPYLIYAGVEEIWGYSGGTHADISRTVGGPYATSALIPWTGGFLNGVPVLNNGVDVPQAWDNVGLANPVVDLANWPSTLRARVLRPHKVFLVAMNITKSGVEFPEVVKWSSPADPGFVPSSWDETDPATLAGETPIPDLGGPIVDGLGLRDSFIIYKQNSVWVMQFVGGNDVFAFRQIFDDVGMLAPRCAAQFKTQHIVLGTDNVYIHDGNRHEPLLSEKRRRELFSLIDPTNFINCFVAVNRALEEAWICFPELGQTYASRALIWNWRDNTFADKTLPGAAHIHYDAVDGGEAEQWDTASGSWNSRTDPWNRIVGGPNNRAPLIFKPDSPEMFLQADLGDTFNGTPFTSYIERTGLAITGRDRQGNPKVDLSSIKFVRAIYPRASVTPGGALGVQIGSQMEIDGPVTWAPVQSFDPSTQTKLDFTVAGRLLAIRFLSTTSCAWKLDGYDLDMDIIAGF